MSGAAAITTRRKSSLIWIRAVIVLAVAAGIYFFVRDAWTDLRDQSFSPAKIRWGWIAVAIASYSVGLLPFWLFWHRLLCALGQSPTYAESFRAHLVGHLGKYVPGKAMVVVLRSGMIRSERTDPTVAATAVFIETLTMMAVGAFVAAAFLLPKFGDHPALVLLAVGMMLAAGLPTIPPVFRRIVTIIRVRRLHADIEKLLDGLTWRVMGIGWLIMFAGWSAFGLSLFASLRALPGDQPEWSHWFLTTGAVALAIVAGFVSLIPAGLGVRELVLLPLLAEFGAGKAIIAVVVARLTWLVSELGISAIVYSLGKNVPPGRSSDHRAKTRNSKSGTAPRKPTDDSANNN